MHTRLVYMTEQANRTVGELEWKSGSVGVGVREAEGVDR